ncbi:hypothetical protein [Stenotrophomonas indicatrix]|uniref:hypothetical protein n=1 Tax=Stenotrophomonas indicatrix TaxID=2045451 RepID=UPI003D8163FD
MDKKSWLLLSKETKRNFSDSTWIPLRASQTETEGRVTEVPYKEQYFGSGSAAFPPSSVSRADKFGWNDLGPGRSVLPHAYQDGNYSPVEVYQYNDNDPMGVSLVFDHPQPVIGGHRWIVNPDLLISLRLIKEGDAWVRPEEDFTTVIREHFNKEGEHSLIEIKRDHLLDYLAARNLNLRIAYYRQRVENVPDLGTSDYAGLTSIQANQDGGRYEILIRTLEDVYGEAGHRFELGATMSMKKKMPHQWGRKQTRTLNLKAAPDIDQDTPEYEWRQNSGKRSGLTTKSRALG